MFEQASVQVMVTVPSPLFVAVGVTVAMQFPSTAFAAAGPASTTVKKAITMDSTDTTATPKRRLDLQTDMRPPSPASVPSLADGGFRWGCAPPLLSGQPSWP